MPLEQAQEKLRELKNAITKYEKMYWLFFEGLTGWGHVLTWLALVTAMANTALGALLKISPASYTWLSKVVVVFGVLHATLTTLETSISPKSLAKPYLVAHTQFERLKKALAAAVNPPAVAGPDPAPALEEDQATALTAKYLKFKEKFDELRLQCPYVYLDAEGMPTPGSEDDTKRAKFWLHIGRKLRRIGFIFEKLEWKPLSP
ncbi:hypothetical protein COCOBI_05-0660 [Coccomyxa sp. Obi]|nr:hypothetical protein COCOBI_05-0660 [Coccomyxa sp. Obi]